MIDATTAAWAIIIVASLAAAVLTVVPVFPGAVVLLAGAIGAALIGEGDGVSWWAWALQVVLVLVYMGVDNLAQALGVQRIGGSKLAMVGGAVGVFVGPLVLAPVIGPFALLVGPPLGAIVGTVAGEVVARRRAARATRVPGVLGEDMGAGPAPPRYRALGAGALVAFIGGMAVKFAVLGVQLVLVVVQVR